MVRQQRQRSHLGLDKEVINMETVINCLNTVSPVTSIAVFPNVFRLAAPYRKI